jgi:hypothetical protein
MQLLSWKLCPLSVNKEQELFRLMATFQCIGHSELIYIGIRDGGIGEGDISGLGCEETNHCLAKSEKHLDSQCHLQLHY